MICTEDFVFLFLFWERLLQRALHGSASTYAAFHVFPGGLITLYLSFVSSWHIYCLLSATSHRWVGNWPCHFSVLKRKEQKSVKKKRICGSGLRSQPFLHRLFIVSEKWKEKSAEIVQRMIKFVLSTFDFCSVALIRSTGQRPWFSTGLDWALILKQKACTVYK